MKNMLKKFLVAVTVISFVMPLTVASAQSSVIKSIKVKGNKAISEATILSKIKMKIGDEFDQTVSNDDLKRLYALGFFNDVSIDVDPQPGGIAVTIVVEEKPVIDKVEFIGNKGMPTRKLQKVIQTKAGDMLNYSILAQDMVALKAYYSQNGYQNVSINYQIETSPDTGNAVVNIAISESTRLKIKKVEVEGNKAVKSKVIIDLLRTKPAWFFFRQGYFDDDTFATDIERVKRYYENMGYLDVDVKYDTQYNMDKGEMYITLKIIEGALYTTGDISITGNLVFPENDIMKLIKMKKGEPFSHLNLSADMEAIRQFYYEKGYMNVGINIDRKLDPATNAISLIYTIDANEVVYVGNIDIKGNTKTKDVVVRREIRIYPGEKFDGSKLRRSKERLYNLGFFEDIFFETQPTADPNVRDLLVSVKETKTGEFAFGGGYSSVDEFMGFIQVTQRNFDIFNWPNFTGDGQFLAIRANVGTVRMDYEVSWTEPWIFDYPLSFGFDAFNRTHFRTSSVGYGYKEIRSGGDVRFGKELTEYLRSDLMYKLEEINISDLSDDATIDLISERGTNRVSSLQLGFTFDTRDNVFVPKKGFFGQAIFEDAGGFLGFDKNYVKGFFLASYYFSFYDKFVLELKGRTGLSDSYGDTDEVPLYERFYAGGAETIRGYKERRVGPRDPGSNDPIGGEGVLIGNVELTFPIYEKVIKGAVFYDVGNVWRHVEDYFKLEGGFKQGVGTGIRVKTPIGPLKLDVGYPLSDNQDDKKQLEWYFSVSQGF